MTSLWADIRHSFRLFARQPFFTAIVVLALATGIGVNSGIFSVVDHVLLKPLPYREPDRLYYLWSRSPRTENPKSALSAGDFEDLRKSSSSFEGMAASFLYAATLTGQGDPVRVSTCLITPGFFKMLGVQPILGNDFEERHGVLGSNRVALLGYDFWLRQFGGDRGVIGKDIVLEGEPHTVLGVMGRRPGESRKIDIYLAYAFSPQTLAARNSRNLTAFVRLNPGVTPRQAVTELEGLAARLGEAYPPTNKGWSYYLVPVAEEVTGTSRQPLAVLASAVGIVLLITCVNLASLLLVRASGRSREVAIRTALGAQRGRIVRQLLTESVLLALLGGAAGLLMAQATLMGIKALAPSSIQRLTDARLDANTIMFTFGLSLATGVLFGLAPALHTLRFDLGSVLREESRGSTGGMARRRTRSLLVISEVAMAAMLVASAGLLVRSLVGLTRVELGFQPSGVLTMRTTLPDPRYPNRDDRARYAARILERLQREPGVAKAAIAVAVPLQQVDWRAEFPEPGSGSDGAPLKELASYNCVSPDYFDAVGIPMRAGRAFTWRDNLHSPPVVILSEAFVRRYYPNASPLGKSFRYTVGQEHITAEIVGVAGNAKHLKPDEPPRPMIYQPYLQLPWPFLAFAIRTTREPLSLVPAARRAFVEVDDQQPVDRVMTLVSMVDATLAQQRMAMILLLAFAGLAVLLASLGLYGLLAYSVAQRTREMGIRTALGATPADVALLVSGEGVLLTLAGAFAGLIVTPWATSWFREMLYDVKPWDPLTFLGTLAILLAVAVAACWGPARRASSLDPAKALHAE